MKEFMYYSSALLTTILIVIGMVWYAKETKKNKKNIPNLLVIGIWQLIAIIMVYVYVVIVQDWFKSALVIAGALANIYVLVAIIKSGNYLFLKRDFLILIGCVVFLVVLSWTIEIKGIYVIIQIANTISYIPLLLGILDRKGKEPLKPWMIITLASVTNLVTILVHYSDIWSLIHPLRALAMQILVIICIIIKQPRATSSWMLLF